MHTMAKDVKYGDLAPGDMTKQTCDAEHMS